MRLNRRISACSRGPVDQPSRSFLPSDPPPPRTRSLESWLLGSRMYDDTSNYPIRQAACSSWTGSETSSTALAGCALSARITRLKNVVLSPYEDVRLPRADVCYLGRI